MAATGEWEINITAPNGAKTHFVFDTSKAGPNPLGEMTQQFGYLVSIIPEHDPEPTPASGTQERKQASKPK